MRPTLPISRRQLLAGGFTAPFAISQSGLAQQEVVRPPTDPHRKRVLRLAHLTDVHVQPEREADKGFAQCLQHAQNQADAPELIVFGGDNVMNVDGDGRHRAKEQLAVWNRVLREECSLPYKIVIGNHDILALDPVDGKQWAMEAYQLNQRYYSFDQAGWRFIVLDSTSPEVGGYKGRLDAEQMDWLKQTLQNTPANQPICVISHIPILAACAYFDGENETSGDWCVPGAWMHIDARAIKDLFYQHPNVRLCLSGHIHLADTVNYLNVTYACNGAVCGGWWKGSYRDFNPGYALVDLFNDGTSKVEFVTYGWSARG